MGDPIGIWGYPFIDLEELVDLRALDVIHAEICAALPTVAVTKTGGTLKWMGIVAGSVAANPYVDAMDAIRRMPRADFAAFLALGDDPTLDPAHQGQLVFGDETDHPFTPAQVRLLEYRHRVYFPWQVVYHFVDNVRWEDKNAGAGKGFLPEAERRFPRTVAFLRGLPFQEIGRCLLFGLDPNDHAPLHRDTEPDPDAPVAHSMTIVPAGNKRLYLMDPAEEEAVELASRAYWFNDMDWHGVRADPFFRYSLRVDGVFRPEFLARLERELCR